MSDMLPKSYDNQIEDYNTSRMIHPSYDYYMDPKTKEIHGFTDGLESVQQAVYLYLSTERFGWSIFPDDDYGIEWEKYIGGDPDLALMSVEYEIKEALSIDTRINDVKDFNIELKGENIIATFTVECIFGSFESEVSLKNV